MKYAPRKVFIKENGEYKELTYEEFSRMEKTDESYAGKKFLPIQGCILEVDEETYKSIYKEQERNRYVQKLEMENIAYQSESSLDNEWVMYGINVLDEEFENRMIDRVLASKLLCAIEQLNNEEQVIVDMIYGKGMSQRKVANALGTTQSTIAYRVQRILDKLRFLMNC